MLERMTTDAGAVIAGTPRLGPAAAQRQMTPWDLAEALSAGVGNTADLWQARRGGTPAGVERPTAAEPAPGAEPPAAAESETLFASETRAVLEQAQVIASQEGAGHLGTEHILAALVRTGPPDVVAWLAARGATAEAVDALLLRLGGTAGVERLPDEMPGAGGPKAHGRQRSRVVAVVAGVIIVGVLFVLCVWGP